MNAATIRMTAAASHPRLALGAQPQGGDRCGNEQRVERIDVREPAAVEQHVLEREVDRRGGQRQQAVAGERAREQEATPPARTVASAVIARVDGQHVPPADEGCHRDDEPVEQRVVLGVQPVEALRTQSPVWCISIDEMGKIASSPT